MGATQKRLGTRRDSRGRIRKPLAVLVAISLVPVQGLAAEASTPTLDSFLTVKSVTYKRAKGQPRAVVKIKVKRDIPHLATFRVYWKYSLDERDERKWDLRHIKGHKGTRTYSLKIHKTAQVARIVVDLSVQQNYERKVKYRLINPRTHYRRFTVSKKLAVANALAMHVPGVVLTVVPETRVIKVVGATILSWTVFKDVKDSVKGKSSKRCPKLRAGLFVEQKSWYSHSGKTTYINSRTKMWTSKKAFQKQKPALCNVSGRVAAYQ